MRCFLVISMLAVGMLTLVTVSANAYPLSVYSVPTAENPAPGGYTLVLVQDVASFEAANALKTSFLTEFGIVPHLAAGVNVHRIGRDNEVALDAKYQFANPDQRPLGLAAGVYKVDLGEETSNPFYYAVATRKTSNLLFTAGVGNDSDWHALLGVKATLSKNTTLLADWTSGTNGLVNAGISLAATKRVSIVLADEIFTDADYQRLQLAVAYSK